MTTAPTAERLGAFPWCFGFAFLRSACPGCRNSRKKKTPHEIVCFILRALIEKSYGCIPAFRPSAGPPARSWTPPQRTRRFLGSWASRGSPAQPGFKKQRQVWGEIISYLPVRLLPRTFFLATPSVCFGCPFSDGCLAVSLLLPWLYCCCFSRVWVVFCPG